jgi:hypothetical protein
MQHSESADSHHVEAMFTDGSPTSSASSFPAVSRVVGPPSMPGTVATSSTDYLKCDVCQVGTVYDLSLRGRAEN